MRAAVAVLTVFWGPHEQGPLGRADESTSVEDNGSDETIERRGACAARVRAVTAAEAASMLFRPDDDVRRGPGWPRRARAALERSFRLT